MKPGRFVEVRQGQPGIRVDRVSLGRDPGMHIFKSLEPGKLWCGRKSTNKDGYYPDPQQHWDDPALCAMCYVRYLEHKVNER